MNTEAKDNNDTMEKFINTKMLVEPTTPTFDVYRMMKQNNIRHVPVVKDGKAIGIISDRDVFFVNKSGDSLDLTASDIMTEDPISVDSIAKYKLTYQAKADGFESKHISNLENSSFPWWETSETSIDAFLN